MAIRVANIIVIPFDQVSVLSFGFFYFIFPRPFCPAKVRLQLIRWISTDFSRSVCIAVPNIGQTFRSVIRSVRSVRRVPYRVGERARTELRAGFRMWSLSEANIILCLSLITGNYNCYHGNFVLKGFSIMGHTGLSREIIWKYLYQVCNGIVFANEYMKDHICELRRKIWTDGIRTHDLCDTGAVLYQL